MGLYLKIVSPEKIVFDGQVERFVEVQKNNINVCVEL